MKKLNLLLLTLSILFSVTASAQNLVEEFYSPKEYFKSRYYSPIELELIAKVNDHRALIGRSALIRNDFLSTKAVQHNAWMITNNTLSHSGFAAREIEIKATLGASKVGEILAYGFISANSVIAAWLNSTSHRNAIEGDYNRVGISASRHPVTGRFYYTMIFAKI